MPTNKEIYNFILNNPGCRLCDIGRHFHVWHCSLGKQVHELESAGLVRVETYSDPANMEYYLMFFPVDKKEV